MKKTMLKAITASLLVSMTMLAGCGQSGSQPAEAPSNQDEQMINVGIVQLMEHGSLDQANQGFIDGLAANGYKEGVNITFDQQNAQNDQSNLQAMAQRFVSNEVDLICAIATPAAQSVASATSQIPIVATAITDFAEAKLVASNEKPETNVTGTTDMNPIKEQIDLLLQLKPEAKTVGVMYSSSEDNSVLQVKIMKDYVENTLGLSVKEGTVNSINDVQQVAQELVTKCDVMYIPTDNVMASSMANLSMITNEAKIPVVCGATSMVEEGGLATLGIDYYKLGLQTGEMAARILNGESQPKDMPIESLVDMDLVINKQVADTIGITISDEILAKAKTVIE